MTKKKTLLQINVTANWGSTGRIAEQIGQIAQQRGWECYMIYGRRSSSSILHTFKSESLFGVYWHYIKHRVWDLDGLSSSHATMRVIQFIDKVKPDVIHLHNIHDHWLNYELLFQYLATLDTPIVWTQHDCWSYTGGCGYYSMIECDQWKKNCHKCPRKRGQFPLREYTLRHFNLKKELFTRVKNLTLVPVSQWIQGEIGKSFLCDKRSLVIYNGVDISLFHPSESKVKYNYGVENKSLLVGVATAWSDRKGLKDYIKLRELLPEDIVILLVGLSKQHIKNLPKDIIGIGRTKSNDELVDIYAGADIVMNLSYEESFGLTTVEGLACGTPGIVYNTTASPELITPETGIIVEPGDISGIVNAVKCILSKGKRSYTEACRKRAEVMFNKNDRFLDYIQLYESLYKG